MSTAKAPAAPSGGICEKVISFFGIFEGSSHNSEPDACG